jgi:lipoprotein-anchoring transpeptidase ErfK/SrfK
MNRRVALWKGLCGVALLATGAVPATAKQPPAIDIIIDVSRQSMTVDVDGVSYSRWKVSTAGEGYHTPRGSWRPFLLKKMHYSRKYDNAPMPHSIFFLGGYAIHATYSVRQLGRPASHGCIRLHPQNAAKLYALVQKHGMKSTRITITN